MKNIKNKILKFLPVIFLLMALTFMMVFKHEDTLSETEAYEFKSISSVDHTIDPRAELERELTEKEFRVTSNDRLVTVYDTEGNEVFTTSLDEWEENRDLYNNKYNLN